MHCSREWSLANMILAMMDKIPFYTLQLLSRLLGNPYQECILHSSQYSIWKGEHSPFWIDDMPFCSSFPRLFNLSQTQDNPIFSLTTLSISGIPGTFIFILTLEMWKSWFGVSLELATLDQNANDHHIWQAHKSGNFTVRSYFISYLLIFHIPCS